MAIFSLLKIGLMLMAGIGGVLVLKSAFGGKKKSPPKKAEPPDIDRDDTASPALEKTNELSLSSEKAVIEKSVSYKTSENSMGKTGTKEMRKEMKNLLAKLSELIDRGFDQSQIARSLAANSDRDVPKHELVPLVDALRRFLSGYDEKSVKAQEKYNLKASDDHKAVAELRKGNPEIAIGFLQRKLGQLEATAAAIRDDGMRANALAQAAEYARHIAVLSTAVDARTSYEFARKSVELNAYDIKNLDLLGYYELGYDNITEAQHRFEQALALDGTRQERIWVELAEEGLAMAKSKKTDDARLKGPEKAKTTLGTNEIAFALDKDYTREE